MEHIEGVPVVYLQQANASMGVAQAGIPDQAEDGDTLRDLVGFGHASCHEAATLVNPNTFLAEIHACMAAYQDNGSSSCILYWQFMQLTCKTSSARWGVTASRLQVRRLVVCRHITCPSCSWTTMNNSTSGNLHLGRRSHMVKRYGFTLRLLPMTPPLSACSGVQRFRKACSGPEQVHGI